MTETEKEKAINEDSEEVLSVLIQLATVTLQKLREEGKSQTEALQKVGDTLAATLSAKLTESTQNALKEQKKAIFDLESRLKNLEASAKGAIQEIGTAATRSANKMELRHYTLCAAVGLIVSAAVLTAFLFLAPKPTINLDAETTANHIIKGMKPKR